MNDHRFTKEERLCSKRRIERLFRNGSSFVVYPYRVVFLCTPSVQKGALPAQCLVSVSKRRFRNAVDRNAIKRRIREAYRLQKSELYRVLREHSLHLLVAFQYVGKEKEPYAMLYQRMGKVLAKLEDERTQIYMGETD